MQFARLSLSSSSIFPASNSHVGFVAAVKSAWSSARAEANERRKINAAIAELEALDDGLLADMGINRGEIQDVVRGRS